jgi:hypothetical protein
VANGLVGSLHMGAQTCKPETVDVNNPSMGATKRTERGIVSEVKRNCRASRKFYDPNPVKKRLGDLFVNHLDIANANPVMMTARTYVRTIAESNMG